MKAPKRRIEYGIGAYDVTVAAHDADWRKRVAAELRSYADSIEADTREPFELRGAEN